MSLTPPPKARKTTRTFRNLLALTLLFVVVAAIIWAVATNGLVEANEDIAFDSLIIETRAVYEGTTVNVVEEEGGAAPVILLNDYDIAGGVVWDGVVAALGEDYFAVRVDLPGFGMSDRVPEESAEHTVASMASVVAALIEDRYEAPVVVAGVGLGGEVAAELAVVKPELVKGLVMIDVDFWEPRSWLTTGQSLPYLGSAITYTFVAGGRYGSDEWAPWCDQGGWCPTESQLSSRSLAASIIDTTASLRSFVRTNPASLVPSDLGVITAPTVFVWSAKGDVPETSVDNVGAAMTVELEVDRVDAFQAHLERPSSVAKAVDAVTAAAG